MGAHIASIWSEDHTVMASLQRRISEPMEGWKSLQFFSFHQELMQWGPFGRKLQMEVVVMILCHFGWTGPWWVLVCSAQICSHLSNEIMDLTRAPGASSCQRVYVQSVKRRGNDGKWSAISKTFMWVLFPGNHFLCLYGWIRDGTAWGLWLSANSAKPEKPWHPTKIKWAISFLVCLQGFCCHRAFVSWEFFSPCISFLSVLLLLFFFTSIKTDYRNKFSWTGNWHRDLHRKILVAAVFAKTWVSGVIPQWASTSMFVYLWKMGHQLKANKQLSDVILCSGKSLSYKWALTSNSAWNHEMCSSHWALSWVCFCVLLLANWLSKPSRTLTTERLDLV